MKYIVLKDCFCERYLNEILNYSGKGHLVKKLLKGDIVEFLYEYSNFYGTFSKVLKNEEIYFILPKYLQRYADESSKQEEKEKDLILSNAIELYGYKHQLLLAVEELAELQKELLKYVNRSNSNLSDILKEVADVEIMLKQIKEIFTNHAPKRTDAYSYVRYAKSIKLERLKTRIENEKKNTGN